MADLPKVLEGEPISAALFNRLIDAINAGPGIVGGEGMYTTGDGRFTAMTPEFLWIGKTSTAVSARSGTTPGAGTVRVWVYNGTSLVDSGMDLAVLNFSSATGGLPTATWCSVGKDGQGNWWILSAECIP